MKQLSLMICVLATLSCAKAQDARDGQTIPMKKVVPQENTGNKEANPSGTSDKNAIEEGASAPDFTLKGLDGKDISLSSLRGKYVVIDFWGSWCGWCVKGIPAMKQSYKRHSEKLEILSIDCRDSEENWKQAVAEYDMPWLHVYNPDDSSLTSDYNIKGFPTKIVVDPKGIIVRIEVGENEEFYKYLDELLGNQ